MKARLLAVFLCSISAWAQVPDCSQGTCAGVGVPSIACRPGNKYAQMDAPGTNWTCSGIPPGWVKDSGGSATTPGSALLFESTVTAVTELDFVTRNAAGASGAMFQPDYDGYMVVVTSFNIGSSGSNGFIPILQFSTNGGTSYDVAASYGWTEQWSSMNSAVANVPQGNVSVGIPLFSNSGLTSGQGFNSTPLLSETLILYNPGAASPMAVAGSGVGSNAAPPIFFTLGAYENISVARNAFRVIMNNPAALFTGTFRVYGLSK